VLSSPALAQRSREVRTWLALEENHFTDSVPGLCMDRQQILALFLVLLMIGSAIIYAGSILV